MANEIRVRTNFVGGLVEDNPLSSGATTLTSAGLASAPAIGSTQHWPIVLDPDGRAGNPEVVYVTAHTAGATTATIERAKESTAARAHARDTVWVHGPTVQDWEAPWVQLLNLAGSEAQTGWTVDTGTWAVNAGGYWENTNVGRAVLYYNPATPVYTAAMILECETYIPSGGNGATRCGIMGHGGPSSDNVYQPGVYRSNSSGTNQMGAFVLSASTTVQDFGNTPGIAFDTWSKIRGVIVGTKLTAYADGVCRGSAYAGADFRKSWTFCLWSQDGLARFRNIKVWLGTGGLPA